MLATRFSILLSAIKLPNRNVRLLEDNLIHNPKLVRHGHKGNLAVQDCGDHRRIWTVASYEPQGILVGLDAFHLAFPYGLCPDRHHRLVVQSEAVAHWCLLSDVV